ncbi:MAG TPA: DNA translocase FtsK 4TM domain-containing protein, partial [Flavitalea sp.]|nr:DNA translocase FtsK 4TM domain-containing protein [Flavitalea sp.]
MANRSKSRKSQSRSPEKLTPEKEEQVRVRELVKDERTRKIAGSVSLLASLFLFIAFTSYLFTWKEDQDKVFRGASILLPSEDVQTANLLGNFGAYVSHMFFYNGFGVASFLFCTLFFVTGTNAILGRKVFSIWRNVRYVLVGILFFSVLFAFIARTAVFPWGGAVGDLISQWFTRSLGTIGTAALLLVAGLAYFIWRFNPVFRVPKFKKGSLQNDENAEAMLVTDTGESPSLLEKTNKKLNGGKGINVIPPKDDNSSIDFTVVGKEPVQGSLITPLSKDENISTENKPLPNEDLLNPKNLNQGRKNKDKNNTDLELEINPVQDEVAEPEEDLAEEKVPELEPYEPTLDLRDYKYPSLDLLETHGSEKIIHDPAELDAHKNQIIGTLQNYDIAIQKISATVGPTVTLYEIVPAPGVRISRIKNLEDDIALSLAALGIRIIAPIPGKGTIGIEVPNVKKTVVSM